MTPSELANNPFFVLELSPSASRMEVERAGQKLLAQLTIQVPSAQSYRTPLGTFARDEDKVRRALAALRDPEQRALHELWVSVEGEQGEGEANTLPGWSGALYSIGWRGPCTS
jgi:hypothetical protein